MPKRPAAYYRPETLSEALQLLTQPDTVPLAGGTKLLAGDVTSAVVDLQLLGLNEIVLENGVLEAGATVRLSDLAAWLQANGGDAAALLLTAIRQAGPNTYRNAATLGGTIASRLPDSELLAVLLVLEASLVLYAPAETEMSLAAYLAAEERPSGLITHIRIPWGAGTGRSERVARTPADYPIVAIVCWQPAGEKPRLAGTGLGKRPFRLTAAEACLTPQFTDEMIQQAAAAAHDACHHPGDFRGDAEYRADMAAVLTRRVLRE
ncbi:MAG: hypothetical protein D6706_15815 [Chloroflexi bacterium]|nr:MAG: hypothetical protein D6706_15815 [Chloroflexota bacterium]